AWAKAKMLAYGFERVRLQPMTTPVWTRGEPARASLLTKGGALDLRVVALGGSVGTPKGGLDAEVIEVQSLDEVTRLGHEVAGKIVFYNRPMDPSLHDTFSAYGKAIDQRTGGPSRAAQFGAVATLVRSMTTLVDDDHPHTGSVAYRVDTAMVPAG